MSDNPRHIVGRSKYEHIARKCAEYLNDRFPNTGCVYEYDESEDSYLVFIVNADKKDSIRNSNGWVEAARGYIAGMEQSQQGR